MHSTKLGGNEHVFAIDTRFLEGFTYFVFVAVARAVSICVYPARRAAKRQICTHQVRTSGIHQGRNLGFRVMDFVTCGGGMADAHTVPIEEFMNLQKGHEEMFVTHVRIIVDIMMASVTFPTI